MLLAVHLCVAFMSQCGYHTFNHKARKPSNQRLFAHMCVYACVCKCVYVLPYIQPQAPIGTSVRICLHLSVCIYIHMSMPSRPASPPTIPCLYISARMRTYACEYASTCTYKHHTLNHNACEPFAQMCARMSVFADLCMYAYVSNHAPNNC